MCSWALVRRRRLISNRCQNPLLVLHCHEARNPWSKESNWLVKWKMQKEKKIRSTFVAWNPLQSNEICRLLLGIWLQYVDICWFCIDDEIIVDMAASISKRTRCYSWKTKSSTQYSSNIWHSIIVHTWCLRLWWVKSWWPWKPSD